MPPNGGELVLDPVAFRELAFVATLSADLPQIAQSLNDVSVGTDFPSITEQVAGRTGRSASDVERVLLALLNLLRIRSKLRVSSQELVDRLSKAYLAHCDQEGKPADRDAWTNARDAIRTVVEAVGEDHPLEIAQKAERLAYAHQRILANVSIITELRPIFSEAGDRVLQGIIVNTLLIDYVEGSSRQRLEIGLDAADVTQLGRISQRAEMKALALKDTLKPLGWPATIYPEEESR
jgi:hypothetical protein